MNSAATRTVQASKRLKRRRQTVPVLIVLNGDGTVEVFGDSIRVHFVRRLDVQTLEAERLADEYLDLCLPQNLQALYVPRNLAGVDQCRPHSVEDEADLRLELDILRELRGLQAAGRAGK